MPAPSSIKHAQKESTLLRMISSLLLEVAVDDPALQDIVVTRVKLSPDGSICTIYFYTSKGRDHYKTIEPMLRMYRPSLRKAVADKAALRHTPDFKFHYDENIDKQKHVEELFESIKKDIVS